MTTVYLNGEFIPKERALISVEDRGFIFGDGIYEVVRVIMWASAKWNEKKPMLPVPDGIDYVPIVIAGVLIVLFSIEHVIALMRGTVVEPAWN